jgi:hypothetical protein
MSVMAFQVRRIEQGRQVPLTFFVLAYPPDHVRFSPRSHSRRASVQHAGFLGTNTSTSACSSCHANQPSLVA